MRALRVVGAIVAGAAASVLIIFAIERASSMVYPPPADLDMTSREAMSAYVQTLPVGAFLFVLTAWFTATLVGAWLATRLARTPIGGFVVGALLLASGIANMLLIPHPIWFWVAGVAIFIATTFFATRIGGTTGRTA